MRLKLNFWKHKRSAWCPPINLLITHGEVFRFSTGFCLVFRSLRERWLKLSRGPIDDLRVGPEWLVFQAGWWRFYLWAGFKLPPTDRRPPPIGVIR